MVDLYVELIIAGRRTFDKVPKKLQEDVKAALADRGLGTDGQPLPTETTEA